MSTWPLLGVGLSGLLGWLSLPVLAWAVRSQGTVNPAQQHRFLLLALLGSLVPMGIP